MEKLIVALNAYALFSHPDTSLHYALCSPPAKELGCNLGIRRGASEGVPHVPQVETAFVVAVVGRFAHTEVHVQEQGAEASHCCHRRGSHDGHLVDVLRKNGAFLHAPEELCGTAEVEVCVDEEKHPDEHITQLVAGLGERLPLYAPDDHVDADHLHGRKHGRDQGCREGPRADDR